MNCEMCGARRSMKHLGGNQKDYIGTFHWYQCVSCGFRLISDKVPRLRWWQSRDDHWSFRKMMAFSLGVNVGGVATISYLWPWSAAVWVPAMAWSLSTLWFMLSRNWGEL